VQVALTSATRAIQSCPAADSDSEADSGAEADSEADSGAEADSEADSGADSGAEADSGADSEAAIGEITRLGARRFRVSRRRTLIAFLSNPVGAMLAR
jgi:hypothetical protein